MTRVSLILWILLASACGDSSELVPRREDQSDQQKQPLPTYSDFGAYLKEKAKLNCQSPDGCQAETVAIYNHVSGAAGDEMNLSVCTGTLIADDLIMTNMHCVLDKMGNVKSNCQGDVYIQNQNQTLTACRQIISNAIDVAHFSHEVAYGNRDLVLLRLSQPQDIAPAVVSNSGFKSGARYTIDSIDFDESLTAPAQIIRQTCLYTTANEAIAITSPATLTLAGFTGCQFSSGHSGSGIRNESGEYLGLLFAKLDSEIIADIWRQEFAKVGLELDHRAFDDYGAGIGLDFQCLDTILHQGEIQWQQTDTCPATLDDTSIQRNIAATKQRVFERVATRLAVNSDLRRLFRYQAINDGQKILFAPTCINPQAYNEQFGANQNFAVSELKAWSIVTELSLDQQKNSFFIDAFDALDLQYNFRIESDTLGLSTGNTASEITLKDCL